MALPTLSTHWKFLRLARLLGSRVLARGVLETLWEPCWSAGDPYVGTSDDVEALCEWKGERGALTKALVTAGGSKGAGFLEPYEGRVMAAAEPHYQVHDFLAHCPGWVRRRRDREADQSAPKTCTVCSGEYFSKDVRSRYCGPPCKQLAYRRSHADESPLPSSLPSRDGNASVTHAAPPPATRDENGNTSNAAVTDAHGEISNTIDQNIERVTESDRLVTPVTAGTVRYGTVRCVRTNVTSDAAKSAAPIAVEDDDDLNWDRVDVDPPAPPPPAPQLDRTSAPQTPAAVASVTALPAIVLTFPVVGKGGPTWHLREDQLARWQTLYPALDVIGEARQALAWIEAVPSRRKTGGGMAKCLVAWFNRSIDSPKARGGPTIITGSLKTAGNKAALAAFAARGRTA